MTENRALLVAVLFVAQLADITAVEEPRLLQVYEAGNVNLRRWYDMIEAVSKSLKTNTDEEVLWKLANESCNNTAHAELPVGKISMCDSYKEALENSSRLDGLLTAECLAIYMYSSEFFETYNPNLRNQSWEPYKVVTSLIYTAIKKLVAIRPLPSSTVLYRGLNNNFIINATGRFYFPTFSSTSLNKNVAERYGNKTTMQFVPSVPKLAGRLKGLVKYEEEEEVLLPPFEAFEMINKTGSIIYLKSSDTQDFFESTSRSSPPSSGMLAIVALTSLSSIFGD